MTLTFTIICTGEIKSSVILDHEFKPNYHLIAQATDGGGRWCRAEVHLSIIDVNDSPPVFTLSQYIISVYEDTTTKALLTRIQAIDPDEGETTTTASALNDVTTTRSCLSNNTFSFLDSQSGILRPLN